MSSGQPIRSFDYINHPYDRVREALTTNPVAIFSQATQAARSRVQSLASALRVEIAGIEVGKEIAVTVNDVIEKSEGTRPEPRTRMAIEWEAASTPGLFPLMKAEISLYPLTATETQLDFSGHYTPPGGWLGSAVDAVIGRKIAEASVQRFVNQVAEYLRQSLAE